MTEESEINVTEVEAAEKSEPEGQDVEEKEALEATNPRILVEESKQERELTLAQLHNADFDKFLKERRQKNQGYTTDETTAMRRQRYREFLIKVIQDERFAFALSDLMREFSEKFAEKFLGNFEDIPFSQLKTLSGYMRH